MNIAVDLGRKATKQTNTISDHDQTKNDEIGPLNMMKDGSQNNIQGGTYTHYSANQFEN